MSFDEHLDKLLSTDGLAEAEKITGKSYKEDNLTQLLGLANHIANSRKKADALALNRDSYFGMSLDEFIEVACSLGFAPALIHHFSASHLGENFIDMRQFFYWHNDGILLVFDEYIRGCLNSGKFHYCVEVPNETEFRSARCTSSGCSDQIGGKSFWAGYHDCREGMRFNIEKLRKYSRFTNPWTFSCGGLYFLNWGDRTQLGPIDSTRLERIKKLELERFNLLPDYVREALACVEI